MRSMINFLIALAVYSYGLNHLDRFSQLLSLLLFNILFQEVVQLGCCKVIVAKVFLEMMDVTSGNVQRRFAIRTSHIK